MVIESIKSKFKTFVETVELVFYYNSKFNSTFPILSVINTIIYIIIFSTPVLQQLFLRLNYLPEEQVQFLDTTYQPLNKINPDSIKNNIHYNELLSLSRNPNFKNNKSGSIINSNNYINSEKEEEELNVIGKKSLKELDKDKLGKYISIIEHIIIDTKNIYDEYKLGRGQGVLNKDTIIQTWKIQELLQSLDIEIPEQYLIKSGQPDLNNNNDKNVNNKYNNNSNLNSMAHQANNNHSTTIEDNGSIKIDLDKHATTNNNIPLKKTFNLNDICIKDTTHHQCIIHSPLIIWNYNITKLETDNNIIDTITNYVKNNVNEIVSFHSIFGGISFSSSGKIQSSNSLILTFFLESKTIPGTTLLSSTAWSLLYQHLLKHSIQKEFQDVNVVQYKFSNVFKELTYNNKTADIIPSEYIVLSIIYFLLFWYISSSIGKVEFVKSKYLLGFVAVVSVSLSLIISLGFLEFLLGINSSMFYPWSVFPYLIMTIGIENILVIVKSVVNTSIELPFNERYALGMKNIAWEIIIPLIINVLIISCGTFSSHGTIGEFCFYTSICIVFNFWLQTCLFGTVLSMDIKKLELYDLYTIQTEKNHEFIENYDKNIFNNDHRRSNKHYHPLLDVQSDNINDLENMGYNSNSKNRKVRWNWTIVFIVLSILIFGTNINQEEESEDIFYSENYNKTYNVLTVNRDSIDFNPDVVTSISHILPKYWSILKDKYNKKVNIEASDFSTLNIDYYVVINTIVHISIDAIFDPIFEPSNTLLGFNFSKVHPYIIVVSISMELLLFIIAYMGVNSCIYLLSSKILEYSKRIISSVIHIVYYYVPIFDYETFMFKKYIIPLYQPNFIVKVDKDQLERYQKIINYNCAYTSSVDVHIINSGKYESIDFLIIKNSNQKAISNHYQNNYNTDDENAIILWGNRHKSIYLWSNESLLNKRQNSNLATQSTTINHTTIINRVTNRTTTSNQLILSNSKEKEKEKEYTKPGVYYYRNPYFVIAKKIENEKFKDDVYFFDNFSMYINRPTFQCQVNTTPYFYDFSLDAFSNHVLISNKTILYQWKYLQKKFNHFRVLKEEDNDEILWVFNSNEHFGDVKKNMMSDYLQNQQFYDSNLCAKVINDEEPYFRVIITKSGRIITYDSFMNVIRRKEFEETNYLLNRSYRRHSNSIHLNDENSSNDNDDNNNNNNNDNNSNNISNNSHNNNNHVNTNTNNDVRFLPASTTFSNNTYIPSSDSSSASSHLNGNFMVPYSHIPQIPVCYHYDTLNRLWISYRNKMIICYQLPLLQPLFVLNENDMHFMVLSAQAQNDINITKNNHFYTSNHHWSSHLKGHKRNGSSNDDYDHYINEKLFISRQYSKIMISNEEVGWLVTSDTTGYMTVWNVKEGKVWDNVKCPSPITKIYIVKSTSKKGTWWIVSSHEDETVRLWATHAGILSCAEVWYQPGCNTIACHNGIIAGVRRVRIRDNSRVEKIFMKLLVNVVFIMNFIVNIFLRHYYQDVVSQIDIMYQYMIKLYYTNNRNLFLRTLARIWDYFTQFLTLPLPSSSSYAHTNHERSHHHHHHHHSDEPNHTHHQSSSFPENSVWMWQVWLYNIDTDLPRYFNFTVDKLHGLGVPKHRIIAMPRLNPLSQIYDLTVEEEVNGLPSYAFHNFEQHSYHPYRSTFNQCGRSNCSFEEKQGNQKWSIQELSQLYNDIPLDINLDDLGGNLGVDAFQEFHVKFPERSTSPTAQEGNRKKKEEVLRNAFYQPPVLKINHININSRIICFDYGQQLRVITFKNIEKKRKIYKQKNV